MSTRQLVTNDDFQDLKKRLEKLESAVFGNESRKKEAEPPSSANKSYDGAKGGVLFLIDKEFFEKPTTASQVKISMAEHGYNYRRQVIQTTLNRLSVKNGPLTAMKEGKTKVYARRK